MTRAGSLDARVVVRLGALHLDAALHAEPGEIVVVVGPNGAGKTTLLRALAGLLPLDEGRIELDGVVLTDPAQKIHVPPERRSVGLVFQDGLLFPHLDLAGNVAFGLRSRGSSRRRAREDAARWLERVGLGDRINERPDNLSGGQAQRVALARALATGPKLVLLDEPLASLDATSRLETRRELRRHLAGGDHTTVLVTHDPLEAMALASRLVVLEEGRVVQQGTAAEISSRPRSAYVADLVGVNLLRADARAGSLKLDGGARLVVPQSTSMIDGPAFALVHPRSVALHRTRPEGTPRNVWEGLVADLDFEGDRVRVKVAGPVPIVAEVTPAAVSELALADGGPVWVSLKATEIRVYPV